MKQQSFKYDFVYCFFLLMMGVLSIILSSCSSEDEPKLPNQKIPSDICGTWYEVNRGSEYFEYLTINENGKVEASLYSNGESMELRGSCYYEQGKIYFEYQNNKSWMTLYGAERSIIEWNSDHMVLGYFDAFFFEKNKNGTPYVGTARDSELIGTWKYFQTSTATSTLNLTSEGKGFREFQSQIEHFKKDVVDWFTRNSWIYIKYNGQTAYTLYRYNISGDTLYLYYTDILEISDFYDYHKQK